MGQLDVQLFNSDNNNNNSDMDQNTKTIKYNKQTNNMEFIQWVKSNNLQIIIIYQSKMSSQADISFPYLSRTVQWFGV